MLVDQVTCRISPEYFVYGKGLEPARLKWAAAELGLSAGFGASASLGCVLLFSVSAFRRCIINYRRLTACLLLPLVAAVTFGAVGGLAFDQFGGDSNLFDYASLLNDEAYRRFRIVFGIHSGVYAGGAFGTVAVIVCALRSHEITRRMESQISADEHR